MEAASLQRRYRRSFVGFMFLSVLCFISVFMVNPFSTETHNDPVYELSPIIVPTNLASVPGAGAISSAQLTENKTQGGLPLGIQPWSAEAQAHFSFSLSDERRLPTVRRPHEGKTTQQDYLRCLAERLNVDVATRTQRPLVHEDTTPLVVFPVMLEIADLRAFTCNVTTTIRYIMYVDNGGLTPVQHFLDDVEKAFGWTGRLVIRRYPWNAGCSGAINNGLDWALKLPAEEVPFVQISNTDVRYPPGLYLSRIREMHRLTRNDPARIRELEAEVAKEDADPATWARYKSGRPLRGEWSPNATLVTSRLLPDRIRYMPPIERFNQFKNHTAFLFFNVFTDTSTYLMSRLAILTVGYNDENNYPAYFEDIDIMWRADLLGYRVGLLPRASARRGNGVNLHYGSALRKLRESTNHYRTAEVDKLLGALLRYEFIDASHRYANMKWFAGIRLPRGYRYLEPFSNGVRLYMPEPRFEYRISEQAQYTMAAIVRRQRNDYAYMPLDAYVHDLTFRSRAHTAMFTVPGKRVFDDSVFNFEYNTSLLNIFS